MLHSWIDLVTLGAGQINDVGQRVNVQGSGQNDGNDGTQDEGELPLMVSIGEQGNADVDKDEVLAQEVQEVEDLFGLGLGLFW